MNELALFAGAGGGILGGHLLGWRTVCAVEWEPYPASVLCARQNDGLLPPFPVWDDVQTFDGKPWRGIVQVVSGGFPCQDISAAGKGAGIDGERSGMWREMARIIYEVQPKYVFVENSPMLTSRGLGVVLGDLAEMGFDAKWGVLGAADVGAPHQRDRIWIVANSNSNNIETGRKQQRRQRETTFALSCDDLANASSKRHKSEEKEVRSGRDSVEPSGEHMANTMHARLEGYREECELGGIGKERQISWCGDVANPQRIGQQRQGKSEQPSDTTQNGDRKASQPFNVRKSSFWAAEPDVGRVADGVAARVDRLKAIGNGQVSEVARRAWEILSKGER